MKYVFHLGHSYLHAEAEVRTLLKNIDCNIDASRREKQLLFIETNESLDVDALIHILGGTTRIGIAVELPTTSDARQVATWLVDQSAESRVVFAISGKSETFGIQVKKEIKQLGAAARFVVVKNSASLLHNKLTTTGIHLEQIGNVFFKTIALHAFEEMASRDYKRPAIDDVSGMLPPKLARIMINLSGADTKSILLDPFCGSGTVLMEAIDLGMTHLFGIDISPKAVKDSKENVEWLLEKVTTKSVVTIKQGDAQLLTNTVTPGSIDVIVTEPYMGKPKKGTETRNVLEQEAKELKKLYSAALDSFTRVLKTGGIVIFSKPRFRTQDGWVEIDWSRDLETFGFEVVPLLPDQVAPVYARASHHVGREIWRLQKK